MVLFGYIARITRASVIESVDADYTRTAYLKGLSRSQVVSKHVLRNSLLPTIAVIATQVGYLIGGLLVIEKLFNYNGIGQRIYVAAQNKDFIMLQSGVMIVGVVYLVATLSPTSSTRCSTPASASEPPNERHDRRCRRHRARPRLRPHRGADRPARDARPARRARRRSSSAASSSRFWVFWAIVGARLTPDDPLGQSDSRARAAELGALVRHRPARPRRLLARARRRVGHAQRRAARDAARDRRRAPASA